MEQAHKERKPVKKVLQSFRAEPAVVLIRVVTTELGRNGGGKGRSVLKIKKAGRTANGLEVGGEEKRNQG